MRPSTLLPCFFVVCTSCAAAPASEPIVTQATMIVSPNDPACRDYTAQAIIDGTPQTLVGHACQQADGSWRVTEGFPGQPQQVVAVYPPEPYLAYPYDPWLWGPPVGLSIGAFVFVDHAHRIHNFGHAHAFGFHGFRRAGLRHAGSSHGAFHHGG